MGRFGSVLPACFIRRLEKRTTNTYESNISSFVPRCQAKLNELTHYFMRVNLKEGGEVILYQQKQKTCL